MKKNQCRNNYFDKHRLCCPVECSEMVKEDYLGTIVDLCPQCGGILLDSDELSRIQRLA
ncbi:MAG: zf-TFIIB domain-containing protein [Psychrobium sp.]|nr:zf-TFIIB domain-containing protein [Psychrobium sp.]